MINTHLLIAFRSLMLDRLVVLTPILRLRNVFLLRASAAVLIFITRTKCFYLFMCNISQFANDLCKQTVKFHCMSTELFACMSVIAWVLLTQKIWQIHGEFTTSKMGPHQTCGRIPFRPRCRSVVRCVHQPLCILPSQRGLTMPFVSELPIPTPCFLSSYPLFQ